MPINVIEFISQPIISITPELIELHSEDEEIFAVDVLLSLSNNPHGKDILVLNLSNLLLGNEPIRILPMVLKNCESLCFLDLSNASIGNDEAISLFFQQLYQHPKLSYLDLSENPLSHADLVCLFYSLQSHSMLLKLDLNSIYNLTREIGVHLIEMLKINHTILSISIEDTPLAQEQDLTQNIDTLLKRNKTLLLNNNHPCLTHELTNELLYFFSTHKVTHFQQFELVDCGFFRHIDINPFDCIFKIQKESDRSAETPKPLIHSSQILSPRATHPPQPKNVPLLMKL